MEIARYLDATYPATTLLFSTGLRSIPRNRRRECLRKSAVYYASNNLRELESCERGLLPSNKRGPLWKAVGGVVAYWVATRGALEAGARGIWDCRFLIGRQEVRIGDTISFADVTIASGVLGVKRTFGAQSQEWKDIEEWNGGRLAHVHCPVCRIRKSHRVIGKLYHISSISSQICQVIIAVQSIGMEHITAGITIYKDSLYGNL